MLPLGNRFLNSKEKKHLLQALEKQFGIKELPQGVYIQNSKEKVLLINQKLDEINFEELVIDSLGLYIGVWQKDGFRLSIEGAQFLAPLSTKNFIELSDEQRTLWLKGIDLDWEGESSDFVIVKHKDDVLGCGKIRQPKKEGETVSLLNYTPKARRLVVVNE